jgi:hypothetical protein
MNPDEFQDNLRSLSWLDLEKFVTDILQNTGRFSEVSQNVFVHSPTGYIRQLDILALEASPATNTLQKWYFEVKKRDLTTIDVVDSVIGKYQDLKQAEGPIHFVFVTSGSLTRAARKRAQSSGMKSGIVSLLLA